MKRYGLYRYIFLAALTVLAVFVTDARLSGAYYGTNYTVPFAHACRALGRLGVDRHQAIDRDVYHFGRLGLNAFRLHLWDVELSDGEGNLLDNEHLELLDYLIAQLEKRNIAIVLTAQTNFGNGYPERNTDPNGAFTYKYDKCHVHDIAEAQAAQERYLTQLAGHVNRYTGKPIAADPSIVAIEINNEPCHSGTHEEITAYVDRMARALRGAGFDREVLYNVSHNLWRTSAFYKADIDGTTYQWYPTGLVHGRRRQGNFLPVLDSYDIPFDTVPGYISQPKYIYEYDPADVLDTYLYPAAARTFRKAGFEWVTQFAYDPVDMARFNTEYQTHFLNTAYTPGKAVGMAIAAEVMRRTPVGTDYGKYPADTVFGDFTVSARRNLAMLNDGKYYYHTNRTAEQPRNVKKLTRIMGVGSSPLVSTDGTGAYFLDRLDKDVWRLEVMPDVVLTSDPFGRPSLRRHVAEIIDAPVAMTITLPGLDAGFDYQGERGSGRASGGSVSLMPGVYLLGKSKGFASWPADRVYDSERALRVGEYTMPPVSRDFAAAVMHTPRTRVAPGDSMTVRATVISGTPVDSVVIYPSDVDFWKETNVTYTMKRTGKYEYSATVGLSGKKDWYKYDIVVFDGAGAATFPSGEAGTPLDWDFGAGRPSGAPRHFATAIAGSDAPVVLVDASAGADGAEYSSIPEAWHGAGMRYTAASLGRKGALRLFRDADAPVLEEMILTKYVGDIMADHADTEASALVVYTGAVDGKAQMRAAVVSRDGFTYSAPVTLSSDSRCTVRLDALRPSATLLTPAPYPSFLSRKFVPDYATVPALDPAGIESVLLYAENADAPFSIEVCGITLE